MLRSIKNPCRQKYEIRVHCPEITFIGRKDQPDFARLDITYHPRDVVIDLKSLKQYLFSFRNELMSYERFINVLYDDLANTYNPVALTVEMELRPRGGISSKLRVDSAWRSQAETRESS